MDELPATIFSESDIKREPIMENNFNTSASVPIPTRRFDIGDYRSSHLENSLSPFHEQEMNFINQFQNQDTNNIWVSADNKMIQSDSVFKDEDLIYMDDDDIFQVDKADLIQGPTLAELNANDETLCEINFDDLLLPEDNSSFLNIAQKNEIPLPLMSNHINNNSLMLASSCPKSNMLFKDKEMSSGLLLNSFEISQAKKLLSNVSLSSHTSSSSSLIQSPPLQSTNIPHKKNTTLHELLLKKESYKSSETLLLHNQLSPSSSSQTHSNWSNLSRLSSSAPTHLGPEHIWQRREPRKHLLSTSSLVSTSSISTRDVLSPDLQDFSTDFSQDEVDSGEESDGHYEDFSSDNGYSDDEYDQSGKQMSKKERFFWQYNIQAKGPKGQRLVLKSKMEDPHRLNEITDPVFSPDCSVRGIKHSGKARKGDGNDLTPNPKKLYSIGKELSKLGKVINDMTPVTELPFNVRPTSRKEKNKLASRACRLKKKAQHEANKIKLSGLETEHKRLINGIQQLKHFISAKLKEPSNEKQDELTQHLDKLVKVVTKMEIAGNTTDYVNKILDQVKANNGKITLEDT